MADSQALPQLHIYLSGSFRPDSMGAWWDVLLEAGCSQGKQSAQHGQSQRVLFSGRSGALCVEQFTSGIVRSYAAKTYSTALASFSLLVHGRAYVRGLLRWDCLEGKPRRNHPFRKSPIWSHAHLWQAAEGKAVPPNLVREARSVPVGAASSQRSKLGDPIARGGFMVHPIL